MNLTLRALKTVAILSALMTVAALFMYRPRSENTPRAEAGHVKGGAATIQYAVAHDTSRPLNCLSDPDEEGDGERGETEQQNPSAPVAPPVITTPTGAAKVEQR